METHREYVPNVYILGALALIPTINVINWKNAHSIFLKFKWF